MVDASVKEAKLANDVMRVRSALAAVAYRDRGFHDSEFDDSLAYVSDMDDLWDAFDGEAEKPETEWNSKYWEWILASLMDNFCKERIDLLKRIGKKVYPRLVGAGSRPAAQPPRQSYPTGQKNSQRPYTQRNQSDIPPAAFLIGGAAVILLGCATIGITKTLVATAAVAGGTVLLSKQKRR